MHLHPDEGEGKLYVPDRVVVFNGFSLCLPCMSKAVKRQLKMIEEERAKYEKEKKEWEEHQAREAAEREKLIHEGTGRLVEETDSELREK